MGAGGRYGYMLCVLWFTSCQQLTGIERTVTEPHPHRAVPCRAVFPVPADYLPAAVDPEAPKANRPALCLASSKGTAAEAAAAFTCEASENHMRRLCPCVKGTGGGSNKGSSSSSTVAAAGGAAGAAAGQQDTAAKAAAEQPSSSGSSSSTAGTEADAAKTAAAAEKPTADKGQQQQEELPGADELGATNEEGPGGDASADGAADGEGDMREYEEDPDRGE
jgi:hypothetical protein